MLTRLVHLRASDFADQEMTFNFLSDLIEQTKTRKRIIVFTAQCFTIQMSCSDEHALAAAEMVRIWRTAIRKQLFGVTEDNPLPIRINFQQEGGRIVFPNMLMSSRRIAGARPATRYQPDFKVSMGRQQIPFILGEVGVSDRLTYTKLKSKLWIERGRGAVCSRLFSAESTGEVVCCCEDRRRLCCHSQYCWFACRPRRGGKPTSTAWTIHFHSHY